MSFLNNFLKKFETADFFTINKVKVFFYYSLLMLILLMFLIGLYLIMPLPKELALKGALGGAGIMVLVIISLVFINLGKYKIAVCSYAIPTIIGVAVIRYINASSSPETAFSTYIYYMQYLIIFVALFGKRWHVLVTAGFFILNNIAVWLLVKDTSGVIKSITSTGIINSTIGILTTGLVSYFLITIMGKYTDSLRNDASVADEKVKKIQTAMDMARNGLDVGSNLIQESERMENDTAIIEKNVSTIKQDVKLLSEDILNTKNSNIGIAEATTSLEKSGKTYQAMADNATHSVLGMTGAIENITSVTTKSKNNVAALAISISKGQETAVGAAETMSLLAKSSSSLLELVDVITSISGQIDMLAMNAAIEAAHAGDKGKGFAVVSDEIRRLAEATDQNIKTITTDLGKFIEEIKIAEDANHAMDEVFKTIATEIVQTQSAFEDILHGVTDLASGTQDINRSVSDVAESSRNTASSIQLIDAMVSNNSNAISNILQKVESTFSNLDEITGRFSDILTRAGTVRNLGDQCENVISDLDATIRTLS